jgi:hypothetical protein
VPEKTPLNPWIQRSLFAIVAASLLFSIVLDVILRSNSGLIQMMDIYANSEGDLIQSTNGQNAAVTFENFQTEEGGYATTFYFLGNYALWPRRLYAADSPVVINTGFDLLGRSFSPDDDWLVRHDCAGIMTYYVVRVGPSIAFHARFRPSGAHDWIQLR